MKGRLAEYLNRALNNRLNALSSDDVIVTDTTKVIKHSPILKEFADRVKLPYQVKDGIGTVDTLLYLDLIPPNKPSLVDPPYRKFFANHTSKLLNMLVGNTVSVKDIVDKPPIMSVNVQEGSSKNIEGEIWFSPLVDCIGYELNFTQASKLVEVAGKVRLYYLQLKSMVATLAYLKARANKLLAHMFHRNEEQATVITNVHDLFDAFGKRIPNSVDTKIRNGLQSKTYVGSLNAANNPDIVIDVMALPSPTLEQKVGSTDVGYMFKVHVAGRVQGTRAYITIDEGDSNANLKNLLLLIMAMSTGARAGLKMCTNLLQSLTYVASMDNERIPPHLRKTPRLPKKKKVRGKRKPAHKSVPKHHSMKRSNSKFKRVVTPKHDYIRTR